MIKTSHQIDQPLLPVEMICFVSVTQPKFQPRKPENRGKEMLNGTENKLRVFKLRSQNPVLFLISLGVVEAKKDAKNTAVFLALIENPLRPLACRNPDEGNERVVGEGGRRVERKTQRRSGAQSAFVEPLFGKEWRNIWGHFNPSFFPKKKQLGKRISTLFLSSNP